MSPSFVFSASTGFVQDTVSISDPTVLEGEQTQLQISFANHEDDNLQGKITFYNNDELLGSRDLDLASGETGNYSLDWEASFGEHSFIARAESLRLDGNSVTILGLSTTPREIVIGFNNSDVAQNLRAKGGASAIAAGVIDELYNFVRPLAQRMDAWRLGQIPSIEKTQQRIKNDKELAEGRIKPILTVHNLILSLALLIVSNQTVFFACAATIIVFVIVRIFKLLRRLMRRGYDEE
jgi:hypothetical protein